MVASEAAQAPAAGRPAAAAAGRQQRRPRVAFHLTGFGVFNGVPDNPTTHLIGELPAELEARRSVRHDDYHGHDRRGKGGGEVEEFEVKSCTVLDVSAKVGGRQLRELHAACPASSRGSRERASATPAAPGSATAGSGGGNSGAGHSNENVVDGDGSGAVVGSENGADCSGGGGGGKSADEGGGPGDNRPVQEGGRGPATTKDGSAIYVDDDGEHDGDDPPVTVFVHCGVNVGEEKFALETRGFNEANFRVPDEQGDSPQFAPVEEDNPDLGHCRVTTVPVGDVLSRLEGMGWGPEHVGESHDAGRFVCNYVYYMSLGLCERADMAARLVTAATASEGPGEGASGGEAKDVLDADGGSGGGGDREVHEQTPGTSGAPAGRTRHSLFIHVPSFEAAPKENQLALLVACLSAIAASLSPSPDPTPANPDPENSAVLDTPPIAVAAAAAPAAVSSSVAPPLSLSSYEAAVLAAEPEALSPERSDTPVTPSADTKAGGGAGAATEAATSRGGSTIWDRQGSTENLPQRAAAAAAAGEGKEGGGDLDGSGTQRTVQFALDALADEGGDFVGGQEERGDLSGDQGEAVYYRGEIGGSEVVGDGSGGGGEEGPIPPSGGAGKNLEEAEAAEEEEEETPAESTRRRLIQAGFDGLDVDAAMATTGSDNTEVNMQFLLDITPLLPRGAPSDAEALLQLERNGSDSPPAGSGTPLGGGSGERGRGAMSTYPHHTRGGSGGGGGAWPRVRGAVSPAAMGGVSPKWIGDVSPARDDTESAKPSSSSGGLLSRFRRGHRRVRSTASETANDDAAGAGGRGERSPEQAPSPSTSSRVRSSSTSSPPEHREYARRTTAHAARSHSPPPVRGVGIFGAGSRGVRASGGGGSGGVGGGGAALRGAPPARRSSASADGGGGRAGGRAGGNRDDGWGETLSSGPNLRLALLVRLDLGMTTGTLAAQCARAALAAAQKAEGSGRADTLAVWREAGESIVVLGASSAGSLDTILTIGAASHLPITMVRDKQAAWVGNLGANTCTVAAIGPAPMSALRSIVGSLRVL